MPRNPEVENQIEFQLRNIFNYDDGEIKQSKGKSRSPLPFILTKHQSLDELDQPDANENFQKTFSTSSDQMRVASLSCSELDLLYEKVSKETMTDISFEYLEKMSDFEKETDKEEIVVEKDFKEIESEQEKELDFAHGSIPNQETSTAEFKSNIHKSDSIFEMKNQDYQSIDLDQCDWHDLETAKESSNISLHKPGFKNLIFETKTDNSKLIEQEKRIELVNDEPKEMRSDLCLDTLQEMKSALNDIMHLLQEEHEEKTENLAKIQELIILLNDLKQRKTDKSQLDYTVEKLEGKKSSMSKASHEPDLFESQVAWVTPTKVLPIDALYNFSKLYHKMLTDLENKLHLNSNEESEMLYAYEHKSKNSDNGNKEFNEPVCKENSTHFITELIDEMITRSVTPSAKRKISESNENDRRESKQHVKNELFEILQKKGIECTTQIKHTAEQRPEPKLGINVKKIVSSIEKKSKPAEVLNEQEVNEILKHGKDKVETILHKNPQPTSAEEYCQKTFLENHLHITECLLANHANEPNVSIEYKDRDREKSSQTNTNYLSTTKHFLSENEMDTKEIYHDTTQDEEDLLIYDLPLPDPILSSDSNNDGYAENFDDVPINQRSSELKARSYSETNLTKKELKFSISSDDLDSDQLLSICVIGDKINVKTSSKTLASSTFDVTSTENGFNFTLKSRSQSHFNVSNLFSETHFGDVTSHCSSYLDPYKQVEQFDKETENKTIEQQMEDNLVSETKEERSKKDESQIDFESEDKSSKYHHQSNVPIELNEEEECSILDDSCSIDTVIENKFWKENKERSDSLLNNWDNIENELSNNDGLQNYSNDGLQNFLSVSSSCTSSDGNEGGAFDLEHLEKLSFCSQEDYSEQVEHEEDEIEVDRFDEKQTMARSTMFIPQKELYYSPKVRTKFVATISQLLSKETDCSC